jgi:hypothetical protein
MFPNDPNLTTAQVEDAEPVEPTDKSGANNAPEEALDVENTLNTCKGMLSQITYRNEKFWFQGKPHSSEELLARPAIQRSGITQQDLDALIPF